MKRRTLFGIVFLCSLAITTHILVKSVFAIPIPKVPFCFSNLIQHTVQFDNSSGYPSAKCYAQAECKYPLYPPEMSLCSSLHTKATVFVLRNGAYVETDYILNVKPLVYCGDLATSVEIIPFGMLALNPGEHNVCIVWETWFTSYWQLQSRDELYIDLNDY